MLNKNRYAKSAAAALALALISGTSGCAGVALTAGGLAGGVGVDHTLSGIVYKTFTAPLKKVRKATLTSLKNMEIVVKESKAIEEPKGWQILGSATNREIEVELERLTRRTTRMRVVVKKDGGFLRDSATGTEIIIQTAQILNGR